MVKLVDQWLQGFPQPQRDAVSEALQSASLTKVRRALRLLRELHPDKRGPELRLQLLSTFNLEPMLQMLQMAFECLPSRAELELGPLDDIEGFIAQGEGAGAGIFPHARVILWRLEELLPQAFFPFSTGFPETLAAGADEVLKRVERVVNLHQKHAPGIPLFIATVALPVNCSNRISSSQFSLGLFGLVGRINQKVYEVASGRTGVYVLDLAAWAAREGQAHIDPMLDLVARQPMSAEGQISFAVFLARCLRLLSVPRSKVLALDLDNTLWGGVVGEDGINGLKLGHEFPGNVYLRIQRELLELKNRGILLVLLSKNNEADARQAFEALPEMLLKWDDFAVRKIDWNHKHENLRAAAHELGLGLDSFVFVDDSDYEREQVRQLMPSVRILNDGPDPLHILQCLWETDAFDSLNVSAEDRERHRQYAARGARSIEGHGDDLEEFLRSLQMVVIIEEVGSANMERVVTMLGKTNQFNLTTKRHSHAQVQAILEKAGSIALAIRLRDKFGDQGIVGLLLAVPKVDEATLVVDSLLVSCRALGRGVEDALWAEFLTRANRDKIGRVEAEYIRTPKNALAAKFYDRVGLQRASENGSVTGYELEPVERGAAPSWIAMNRHNA